MVIDGLTRSRSTIRFGYRMSQAIVRIAFKLLFGLRIEGLENIPLEGAFILASNHQSWFDPPIVGSSCPREIHFAAKKELFSMPVVGTVIKYLNSIPVNRSGFDRAFLKKLFKALTGESGIIIFPEGTRHLDGKLRTAKAGIGMIAIKSKAKIIPVYVSGSAQIGAQLFRRNLKIRYGKPFDLPDLGLPDANGKEGYRAVSDAVMMRIAETGGVEPP